MFKQRTSVSVYTQLRNLARCTGTFMPDEDSGTLQLSARLIGARMMAGSRYPMCMHLGCAIRYADVYVFHYATT